MIQVWRPAAFFLGANVLDHDLTAAIKRINGLGVPGSSEHLKPTTIMDTGSLTLTDFRTFATFLKEPAPRPYPVIQAELQRLQKARMVSIHLEAAPDDRISDEASLLSLPLSYPLVTSIATLWVSSSYFTHPNAQNIFFSFHHRTQ